MPNPYLPLWEHLPDGEPRVFEDPQNPGKYRAYIIGSHDVRYDGYCGPDIRAWSAPVENLNDWRDEGPIFTYEINGQHDVMYAPDLVEVIRKDGAKDYYLYPHSRGPGREAMVCKGPTPIGPFAPINLTPDGAHTVPGSVLGFDPAIFVEYITDPAHPDYDIGFRVYGYWGFQKSYAAELDKNTMYSLRPGTEIIQHFIPASASYGVIRDPRGTIYPHVFPGEDLSRFNFFEAASIRKIGNKYVWVYSGYSGPDYGLSGTNSALRYAYGDSPLGPWRSGGVLVDSRSVDKNRDGTALHTWYAGHNTHGSIEAIGGQWYVFYHRAPRGFGYARQPMVAPIHVTWDEAAVADGGKVTIRAWDPYTADNIWTAKAGDDEYTGAEVTSEGFDIYGLDPYQYYSAGIACFLSDHGLQGDAWDIWDDHMPILGAKNGDIVGYKYFDFAAMDKDAKFNLFLTPKTTQGFKVNVWLDGPWENSPWNGRKIGEIIVAAGAPQEVTQFTTDVAELWQVSHQPGGNFLQNKKHAVYLTVEGGEGILCDLVGLGFSSDSTKITKPIVPTVAIKVNGQAVALPAVPVRSTGDNGICGYNLYQAVHFLSAAEVPVVEAAASDPGVIISVLQPKTVPGTAVVTFDYKGAAKTYAINFVEK